MCEFGIQRLGLGAGLWGVQFGVWYVGVGVEGLGCNVVLFGLSGFWRRVGGLGFKAWRSDLGIYGLRLGLQSERYGSGCSLLWSSLDMQTSKKGLGA